ncbi:putative WEB family protein At1g65010, chloroplastic [Magnolia sinica]|uniref:putative WEB family protein At1g65010, chloroplastic n=1 Tax=Magnolia sinica TaxID=86752 RepID=UPI00265941B1|nr:putative WEB family protein At1g65010, chloroplastic [Magnolia sinica]
MQPSKPRAWSSEIPQRTSPPPPSLRTVPYANGTAAVQSDPDQGPTKALARSSSAKIAAMAERRIARGVEMQNQLAQLQEDLKKVKEQLATTEEEKSKILDELREMKNLAEDANSKLTKALVAQRQAQEGWDIEKVRFKELEQASVESAQKRDQAWQLELEALQIQQSLDVEALASATQELNRVNRELSSTLEEKTEAVREAEGARIAADANSKRVKELLLKLYSVKEPLNQANSNTSSAIETGASELGKAKDIEVSLAEREPSVEKLEPELSNEGKPESWVMELLSTSETRIGNLELELEKAKESEAKTFESLISQTKQLEETKISLEEAKLEIASLHENIKSLEVSISQSSRDLSVSHRCLEIAKLDTHSVKETAEALKSELQIAKDNLDHAQEKEELALQNAQCLKEEMNILRNELKLAVEAEEKSKKAMDGLALALKEVTTEANQAKENLISTQSQLEKAGMDVDRLKLRLMRAEEKYQALLDEVKSEADQVARISRQENSKLRDIMKQAVNEASVAKEAAEIARMENSQLKDSLSEMGSTLERINQENQRLKINETGATENVKEPASLPIVETPPNESEAVKKPSTTAKEFKESKKAAKFLSGPLKKPHIPNVEIENPRIGNGLKDEGDDSDESKGSIFDMVPEKDDMHPSVHIMTHRRAASAVLFDDIEATNFDDFDPIDGSQFDEIETDKSLDSKHKKKKALLSRFGGILRKKSSK